MSSLLTATAKAAWAAGARWGVGPCNLLRWALLVLERKEALLTHAAQLSPLKWKEVVTVPTYFLGNNVRIGTDRGLLLHPHVAFTFVPACSNS